MMTNVVTPLGDTTELVELCATSSLYLKPSARIHIGIQLPQLKDPGQSISNWDLMERIKKLIHPMQFASIRVVKSTIEFVRFEAALDNRQLMSKVIKTLDGGCVKVIGFYETLRVRATEAKSDFPTRQDWDSFFREARNMSELKPGERPDTVYMAQLPCRWFQSTSEDSACDEQERHQGETRSLPSEKLLRRVMETFGEIRCVDIPICDRYRKEMSKTGMRNVGFSFGGELTFEGYVQYVEYISFVKAMDALRNMKLVKFDDFGKAHQAQITVDYDRTKHLSDKNIRRRRLERERLFEMETLRKEEEERLRTKEEEQRQAAESLKTSRRRKRENKRRIRRLEQKRAEEELNLEKMIRLEERKLLIAERKLESRRLLALLIHRAHEAKMNRIGLVDNDAKEKVDEERRLERKEKRLRQSLLEDREIRLRHKIKLKYEAKKNDVKQRKKRNKKRAKRRIMRRDSDVSIRTWTDSDEDREWQTRQEDRLRRFGPIKEDQHPPIVYTQGNYSWPQMPPRYPSFKRPPSVKNREEAPLSSSKRWIKSERRKNEVSDEGEITDSDN